MSEQGSSSDRLEAPGVRASISAEEQIALTHSVAIISRLFLLDNFWTRETRALSGAVVDRAKRVTELGSIVEALDDQFQQFEAQTDTLANIFETRAEAINATFSQLVRPRAPERAHSRLTDEERAMLIAVVHHRGGDIARIGAEAARRARDRSPAERGALRTELDRVAAEVPSDGDMSPEQETDIAYAALALSVLLGPEAGIIVEGVAHLGNLAVGLFHSIFG